MPDLFSSLTPIVALAFGGGGPSAPPAPPPPPEDYQEKVDKRNLEERAAIAESKAGRGSTVFAGRSLAQEEDERAEAMLKTRPGYGSAARKTLLG